MTARYRAALPWDQAPFFLTHAGIETDLIFNQGCDLPGFASYPLLETADGRLKLEQAYRSVLELAGRHGLGVQLDSATWVASKDRAAELGYSEADLVAINKEAMAFIAAARDHYGDCPTVLAGSVGPRGDAYAATNDMSLDAAEAYHGAQIETWVETAADLVSAMTFGSAVEAAGVVRAAKRVGLPIVLSFTVEQDGRLPTGATLSEAIALVEAETDSFPEHYAVNCAHPDHFAGTLNQPGLDRLRGFVANASRCSHAELDQAETLDDGDPKELGLQLADLRRRFPGVILLGGCCGTDLRHLTHIAEQAKSADVP